MPSETEKMKLEVTPWTAENQISSLERMCIKWLNLNEITSHPWLLWTGHHDQSHPAWGHQWQTLSTLWSCTQAGLSAYFLTELGEETQSSLDTDTHPPRGQGGWDGAPQFGCLMETSIMEPVFTKYWIALLWTSAWYERCQIPHPLIKPLKRWILIQLTVILGKSWCSQKQQRAQKMWLRLLHWYHDLLKTS